ncbi:unnamed protein product [Prorocentrum cordatum]|uniref:Uncharacterized protein n=1 Tax=Prorocentrum cordatum TaxID=2364126 RepID=A0ABN9RGH3_9DINO|nr:unnamed protein product [Polarella glacialis]
MTHCSFIEPPSDSKELKAFKANVRQRMEKLAVLVIAAKGANHGCNDVQQELAVLKMMHGDTETVARQLHVLRPSRDKTIEKFKNIRGKVCDLLAEEKKADDELAKMKVNISELEDLEMNEDDMQNAEGMPVQHTIRSPRQYPAGAAPPD